MPPGHHFVPLHSLVSVDGPVSVLAEVQGGQQETRGPFCGSAHMRVSPQSHPTALQVLCSARSSFPTNPGSHGPWHCPQCVAPSGVPEQGRCTVKPSELASCARPQPQRRRLMLRRARSPAPQGRAVCSSKSGQLLGPGKYFSKNLISE